MHVALKRLAVAAAGILCALSAAVATSAPALYTRLGGQSVVSAVVSETVDQVVANPRLNQAYAGTNIARVKRLLVEQICDLAGGGCHYSGDSMRQVHANHHITQAQFFGLVEILRQSLRRHHVRLRERNELLALLAPMERDIVDVVTPPAPKNPLPDMLRGYSVLLWGLAVGCAPPLARAASLVVHVETTAAAPIEDAIVYAVPGSPTRSATGSKYSIDQVNRQFVPRVNVVQTGTEVAFPNSDNIRHSVYSFSPAKIFSLKLYAGKSADPVVFNKAGLVVLGCDIHDRMVAWLLVVDTPYFTHTDHGGVATFPRLPPGDYTLHAWHAPMTQEQQTSEPLHVGPGTDIITHTVHVSVAVDPPGGAAMP